MAQAAARIKPNRRGAAIGEKLVAQQGK